MTSLAVTNLWLSKCGSCSEFTSSCEIWRVAVVALLGHLGWVSRLFNDEITREGKKGTLAFGKKKRGLS